MPCSVSTVDVEELGGAGLRTCMVSFSCSGSGVRVPGIQLVPSFVRTVDVEDAR